MHGVEDTRALPLPHLDALVRVRTKYALHHLAMAPCWRAAAGGGTIYVAMLGLTVWVVSWLKRPIAAGSMAAWERRRTNRHEQLMLVGL